MADQQQAAVPCRQARPQQSACRPVERVARFVEDEKVGVVEECAEQRHAHAFAAAQAFARGVRAEMAEPLGGQGVGQALADVPALAQAFVVGGVQATRLDPRQRLQPWADAGQIGDGRVVGRFELLRQVAHAPLAPDTAAGRLQVSGEQAREQRLPTPLRPTSPVCRVSKVSSRSENRRLPSGSWKETPSKRQGRRIRHGYPLMPCIPRARDGKPAVQTRQHQCASDEHLVRKERPRQSTPPMRPANRAYFRFRQTRPTDMARPRISELFEQEPSRWGGRGDPYLWQEMAGQLADASWPASAAALEHLLGETFERLSGHPLEYDALIYLARHAHGGMSSGMVSPEFWRETAIPELLDRYRRRRSG